MGERLTLLKGENLITEGEPSTEMYFLISGKLKVTKNINGEDKVLGEIDKGQLAGEMSFLDKKTRSANVVADTDCEVLIIPPEKFEKVLYELPDWVRTLQNTLIARLRKADELAHSK